MTMEQFIDMCILAGCDYCDTIRGIGPKRALELIRKHGSIEEALKHLDKTKYPLPDPFPYETVRAFFKKPEVHSLSSSSSFIFSLAWPSPHACVQVTDPEEIDLKWTDPDEEGLLQYLVHEKKFNEERVRKGIEKLKKARTSAVQGRLDGFFKNMGTTTSTSSPKKEDPKGKGVAGRGRGRGAALRGGKAAACTSPLRLLHLLLKDT